MARTAGRLSTCAWALLYRLADRDRPPRSWWYPYYHSLGLEPDDLHKQYETAAATIRGLVFGMLGACVFCLLTLGKSDVELLNSEARVAVPFTGVQVEYGLFLMFAPSALMLYNAYLQLYLERWYRLRLEVSNESVSHFFTMRSRAAEVLGQILFYWVLPLTLLAFSVKALPHPRAGIVLMGTCFGICVNLFLLIRRNRGTARYYAGIPYRILAIFALTIFSWTLVRALNGESPPLARTIYLQQAELQEREIVGFYMPRADMRRANLNEAVLRCSDLRRANLVHAKLGGADLYRASFYGAVLLSADLRNARLLLANFRGANLGSADLRGARVSDELPDRSRNLAHLTNWLDDTLEFQFFGADGAVQPFLPEPACAAPWLLRYDSELRQAGRSIAPAFVTEHPDLAEREDILRFMTAPDRFIYGYFEDANLRGADLRRADFRRTIFRNADLSSADAREANFRFADFSDAILRETDFRGADLSGARFAGADVEDARFAGATLDDVTGLPSSR